MTFPTAATEADVVQRGRYVIQHEARADVREGLAGRQQPQQFGLVAAGFLGTVRDKAKELEAANVDALEQHEVERDLRDGPTGVTDGHEAAAVAQGP